MLNVETDGIATIISSAWGRLYFNWPTPEGYPDTSEAWQGNLMPRWQFAFALIRDELNDTKHNLQNLLDVSSTGILQDDVDAISSLLVGARLDRFARNEIIDTVRAAGATDEETRQIIAASIIASLPFNGVDYVVATSVAFVTTKVVTTNNGDFLMLTQTWLPRLSFAPVNTAPRGDTLVVVFLRGAADVLNMVVPHGEDAYYQLRPSLGIARPDDSRKKKEERSVDLDGFFWFASKYESAA
ncbi:DUF1800 family protein [Candidatus Villigracilis proximus]|uniref:DUF1800 family protein n=1 Tax=Candidatus Villigracilis proximus TaxID=3140683 RepID=UPI0031EF4B37